MDLNELLTPESIVCPLKAGSKKQTLQELSAIASKIAGVPSRDIFETLLKREKLGSTGVGQGIAIPHGKLPGLNRLFGVFARLDKPIDFEAMDDEPVDLVFLLLAPESAGADHLKALARVSRLLRDPSVVQKLRESKAKSALHSILIEPAAATAA